MNALSEEVRRLAERRVNTAFGGAIALSHEYEALEAENAKLAAALKNIRDLAEWYSTVHAGPEHEIHHALKVEVLDLAETALNRKEEP